MVQSPFGPADSTNVDDPREIVVRFNGDRAEPYRFRCRDGYVLVMNFRIEDEPKLAWVRLEGNEVDGGYRVFRNRWDLRVTPDGQLR